MKNYETLEIYNLTYRLLERVTHSIKHIRKDLKYILGSPILKTGSDIILKIYKANSCSDLEKKCQILQEIQDDFVFFGFVTRLCKDMQGMSIDNYAEIIEALSEIKSSANKWLDYSLKSLAKKNTLAISS